LAVYLKVEPLTAKKNLNAKAQSGKGRKEKPFINRPQAQIWGQGEKP
jgi:hypothetical protein